MINATPVPLRAAAPTAQRVGMHGFRSRHAKRQHAQLYMIVRQDPSLPPSRKEPVSYNQKIDVVMEKEKREVKSMGAGRVCRRSF